MTQPPPGKPRTGSCEGPCPGCRIPGRSSRACLSPCAVRVRSPAASQTRGYFLFPGVHGIFIPGPPPRHPPIVAVEGFPMPGYCRVSSPAPASRRVGN
ncbi:hypothetical protein DXK94_16670 [Arthrobacter sp. RT-1]|nr:hypothetical protein DXK94_16670 [Arthrobacter sp. RT-1]